MPAHRKPTALKVLQGNAGHRPLNGREPNVRSAVPKAPAYLSDRARQEWRMLARELGPTRMLNPVDRAALGVYCEAVARLEESTVALRALEEKMTAGTISADEIGQAQWRINTLSGKRRLAAQEVLKFGQDFGLTPASRGKITVPDPQTELPLMDGDGGAVRFDPLAEARRQLTGA
ncbi:MAG: hypothetical protein QG602_425 [Verrucomicrobiota bacterium]|nr:hypothetical protein [Verrucomicrobiota bacterium]